MHTERRTIPTGPRFHRVVNGAEYYLALHVQSVERARKWLCMASVADHSANKSDRVKMARFWAGEARRHWSEYLQDKEAA